MIKGIVFQNFINRKISFGLNSTNTKAIEDLNNPIQDKFTRVNAINSMDMSDEDINPVLNEFSKILKSPTSSNLDLNAVLDKIKIFKGGIKNLQEGFSALIDRWTTLFLSVRTKASEIMDENKIPHPHVGVLSRTASNPLFKDTALRNLTESEIYIEKNTIKNKCPDKQFLLDLHKIITKDLSYITSIGKIYTNEQYTGIIRGSSADKIINPNETVDTPQRLDKFFEWLNRNYDKNEPFMLAAQSYKKLLGIIPFYDANGRTIRAFIDALLLSKGYKIQQYPANYAEIRNLDTQEITNIIKKACGQ